MDADIYLNLEPGLATSVDPASNGARCGLILSFHF